jgi:hypothetical protein
MANSRAGSDGVPDPHAAPHAPGGAAQRLDAALRATPSRYHAGYEAARRDLEAAVCAAVEELRGRGLRPEQVLVIVKAHVAAHAAHPTMVLDDVVRWCITRYYDPPAARDCTAREPGTDHRA